MCLSFVSTIIPIHSDAYAADFEYPVKAYIESFERYVHNMHITVKFNKLEQRCIMYAAIFTSRGYMRSINKYVLQAGSADITIILNEPNIASNDELKLFFFDNKNMIKPVGKSGTYDVNNGRVIFTNESNSIDYSQSVAIVKSVTTVTLDDSETIAKKVSYYAAGSYDVASIIVVDDSKISRSNYSTFFQVVPGAFMVFTDNDEGTAIAYEVLAIANTATTKTSNAYTLNVLAIKDYVTGNGDGNGIIGGYIDTWKAVNSKKVITANVVDAYGKGAVTGTNELIIIAGINGYTFHNRTSSKIDVISGDWAATTVDVKNGTDVTYFLAFTFNRYVTDFITFSTRKTAGVQTPSNFEYSNGDVSAATAQISASTPIYFINSVGDVNDAGGNAVKNISYIKAGETEVKTIKTDYDEEIPLLATLKSGDIIKFAGNPVSVMLPIYVENEEGNRVLTADTGEYVAGYENNWIKKDSSNAKKDNYYQVVQGTIYSSGEDDDTISIIPGFYGDANFNAMDYTAFKVDDKTVVYKYNTKAEAFEVSDFGAFRNYEDVGEADPANATQALTFVVEEKVVAIYIIADILTTDDIIQANQ